MILLTKLLLAHIIGDFILQPQKWVKEKEDRKLKSPKFYLHIALHFVLLFLIVFDLTLWPLIVAVGVSHFIIDTIKLLFQKEKTKRLWFFIDQLSHVLVIVWLYISFIDNKFPIEKVTTESALLLFTCLLFLTYPVSVIMKVVFTKWNIDELTKNNESLEDAGMYIGILERTLVFMFIIFDHWEAVGFLITAKSVFRFGDLKESKHRKLTEYILIGTLISFGIAIVVGLLFNFVVINNFIVG